jgi:hypothetical protein
MTKILAYVTSTLKKNGGSREKHQWIWFKVWEITKSAQYWEIKGGKKEQYQRSCQRDIKVFFLSLYICIYDIHIYTYIYNIHIYTYIYIIYTYIYNIHIYTYIYIIYTHIYIHTYGDSVLKQPNAIENGWKSEAR